VPFTVIVPHVNELAEGNPTEVAQENALRKARAVAIAEPGDTVLGADTVVALGAENGGPWAASPAGCPTDVVGPAPTGAITIFGKPADERDARQMLRALSGRTHAVIGGVALRRGCEERITAAYTQVSFRALGERLLDWYLATGEWRGRAGAYAIQGAGAALVREVHGDYENVVGLPLASLLDMCPDLLAA
jgi:septum formation protein